MAESGDYLAARREFEDLSDKTAKELAQWHLDVQSQIDFIQSLNGSVDPQIETLLRQDLRSVLAELKRRRDPAQAANTAVLLKISDVKPKKLRWLWPSRIPLAKITIEDGDPGLGKSLISIDIAARLSKGRPMPNAASAELEPAGAVFLSAEDDPEDTIQPRLALVGADLARMVLLQAVKHEDGLSSFPTIADLNAIREGIKEVGAKLVVIDPLMAYLPAETNSYRDQDIRRSLAPLAALAADLDVAILVIRHLNKTSNSNPIYRGGGSIGIIGAARSGLMVAKDPDDDSRCILSVAKSNLAKLPASLAYRIMSNQAEIPFIDWLGTTQHTAASLLHDQADSEEDRSAVKDAEDFLMEYLKDMPRKAGDVLKAMRPAGISEKTLRRAKIRLKIQSKKSDFQGEYFWSLPESNDGQTPQ
jgi:RecA-family ATPase